MEKDNDMRCGTCGLPSEVLLKAGMQLELQKDGTLICPICVKLVPKMVESIKAEIIERANEFSDYMSISAAMFRLDTTSVCFASGDIFLKSLTKLADADVSLAVDTATKFTNELTDKLLSMSTKIRDDDKNAEKSKEVKT